MTLFYAKIMSKSKTTYNFRKLKFIKRDYDMMAWVHMTINQEAEAYTHQSVAAFCDKFILIIL